MRNESVFTAKLTTGILVLMIALAHIAGAQEPMTIHMATSGLDTNTGTIEAPVATIDKAIKLAEHQPMPCEIVVHGGTYFLEKTVIIRHCPANKDRKLVITGGECVPLDRGCRPTGKLWMANLNSENPAIALDTEQCGYFRSASLSPKGDHFATAASRPYSTDRNIANAMVSEIQMRSIDNGEILWRTDGKTGEPYGVTISPDGRIVGYCLGNWILMFDTNTGALVSSIDVPLN